MIVGQARYESTGDQYLGLFEQQGYLIHSKVLLSTYLKYDKPINKVCIYLHQPRMEKVNEHRHKNWNIPNINNTNSRFLNSKLK
jgi:hypothetical protein